MPRSALHDDNNNNDDSNDMWVIAFLLLSFKIAPLFHFSQSDAASPSHSLIWALSMPHIFDSNIVLFPAIDTFAYAINLSISNFKSFYVTIFDELTSE